VIATVRLIWIADAGAGAEGLEPYAESLYEGLGAALLDVGVHSMLLPVVG
jgi:hypothetical protein